jgi:Asp-tRNA(Asn)/Glu-tRNA(Gln) amidotransferase B subunit
MEFEAVIGLEAHVPIKTRSKQDILTELTKLT